MTQSPGAFSRKRRWGIRGWWRVSGVRRLFGAENAVASVSEAGPDVAVFVELTVNRSGINRHIGMGRLHGGDAFRTGQQAHELDRLGAACFQPLRRSVG